MAKTKTTTNGNGANIGNEAQLWQMADALRGSMDAGECKHVTLGLRVAFEAAGKQWSNSLENNIKAEIARCVAKSPVNAVASGRTTLVDNVISAVVKLMT